MPRPVFALLTAVGFAFINAQAQASSCDNETTSGELKALINEGRDAYFLVDSSTALAKLQQAESTLACTSSPINEQLLSQLYMTLAAVWLDLGSDVEAEAAMVRAAATSSETDWDPMLESAARGRFEEALIERTNQPSVDVEASADLGGAWLNGGLLASGETIALAGDQHFLQVQVGPSSWAGEWLTLASAPAQCVFTRGETGAIDCLAIEEPEPASQPAISAVPMTLSAATSTYLFDDPRRAKTMTLGLGGATLIGAGLWGWMNYSFYVSETIQTTDPNYTQTALLYYGLTTAVVSGLVSTTIGTKRLRTRSKGASKAARKRVDPTVHISPTAVGLTLRW